jgi:hypothetical protein
MKVTCTNINYYTQQIQTPEGPFRYTTSASVTFAHTDEDIEQGRFESFTLTFNEITSPVDYFPGQSYEMSLEVINSVA